jgi:hypothetical protein
MRKYLSKNFKYIMIPILIILIGILIYDIASKDNGMSKEDKIRLEQLDKDINNMIDHQKQLDVKIEIYNKEIEKVDSVITNIKIKKEVVNNYYQQKGEEIKNADVKQIDSLLRSRYKF